MMDASEAQELTPVEHKTVRERLVDHLDAMSSRYDDYRCPYALTQSGMAEAIGVTRPHASIWVRRLLGEGMVEMRLAHVRMPDGSMSRTRARVYVRTEPVTGGRLRSLQALATYTFAAYGPNGCKQLRELLRSPAGERR